MELARRYWLTGLATALAVFLLVLAFLFGLDTDESGGQRVVGALVAGVPGVALLGGLWYLHTGRVPISVSTGAVVLGLVGVLIFWWMVIPALAAAVVFWLGVVRKGRVRELATS